MTEKKAIKQGLNLTGCYSRSKEIAKAKAARIRSMGFHAVVATVPDSPLSRGPKGVGYSVYAEDKYFVNKELIRRTEQLAEIPFRKEAAKLQYQEQLAKIEGEYSKILKRIEELNTMLNEKN